MTVVVLLFYTFSNMKGSLIDLLLLQQNKVTSISLKTLLFLVAGIFAVAAALLVILYASAATMTGKTPFLAVSLVDSVNTGVLSPGEQRWFKFKPDKQGRTGQVEKSFTLKFIPTDGNRVRKVTLQLFKKSQLIFFNPGDAGQMANFGAGQVISGDHNPDSGELFWTGWLFGSDTYYLQIANGSDVVIDYWMFDEDDVANPEFDSQPAPALTPVFAAGASPQTALPLNFGLNKGGLDPGQETWYSFRLADQDQEFFEEMALTMITTPDDGNRIWHMTFDVYTAEAVKLWSPGNDSGIDNVGAGSVVVRDNNPLTGERFWTGWVVDNGLYYVKIRNSADAHMDYWLFTGDIYGAELGPETN